MERCCEFWEGWFLKYFYFIVDYYNICGMRVLVFYWEIFLLRGYFVLVWYNDGEFIVFWGW